MARYLRSKEDGRVFIYNEFLAQRDDMEEISEAEAEGKKPAKKRKDEPVVIKPSAVDML